MSVTDYQVVHACEVFELVRCRLNPKGIDYGPPPVPQAPPGRDPLVSIGTDKVEFFKGDWREAWPKGFRAHKEVSSG